MATAVHEIGHLFGLAHCQAWECQMNGTNHLAEADSRPMEFCPACQQKLVWFSGADPLVRVRGTAALVREQGLANDADFFEKEVKALSAP
jgi:archaemetzincin